MMMTIGPFSQITGLTIKALRHYDSIGRLPPAETDPATGFRRYETAQITIGAQIGLLRTVEVPLDTIAEYLRKPESQTQVLQQYRERVLAARQAQDQMWEDASAVLADYRSDYPVHERQAATLHWVGMLAPIRDDETPCASEEDVDQFLGTLARQGVQLRGPFWTAFRGDGETSEVAVVLATGIEEPLPAALRDHDRLVCGTLPQRRELYVRVDSATAMRQDLSAPHPGAVALLTSYEQASLKDFRQVTTISGDGQPSLGLVVDLVDESE